MAAIVMENKELMNKDYILSHLFIEVAKKTKYADKLNEITYTYIYETDLIAIFRVRVDNGNYNGSYILTRKICDLAGIKEDELVLDPDEWIVKTLPEMMSGLSGKPVEELDVGETIYVLTNKNAFYGSNVMFRTEILDKVADIFGGEMWIIPSSVHEILCVRKDLMSYDDAADMIKSVNNSVVDPKEIMSDHPYCYSSEYGFI